MKIKKLLLVQLISGLLIAFFAKYLFDLKILSFILFLLGMILAAGIGCLIYIMSGAMKADKEKLLKENILKDEKKISDEIAQLEKDLLKADQPVASQQAELLLKLLSDFTRVVMGKFGDTAITQSSYISESKRVFGLVRQNLKDIMMADISIETVEEKYGNDIPAEDMALVSKQRTYILEIIENNKELLKALNTISVEVASIKDIESFEYEQSLNRLKELTQRAKAFSKE